MAWPKLLSYLSLARPLVAAGALSLAACGGGGGGGGSTDLSAPAPPPSPDPTGTAIIGLTDAPGDFLSYQVTVTGLQFERANGAIIEVLPESTTVDFAQYVETTELLTAASLPAGAYRSVTLGLDYSAAQILVEADDGSAVAATVVDNLGAPVAFSEVTVNFENDRGFVITANTAANVTLDFDLEASHKVELLDSPPTATFDGVLTADTLLEFPKPRRARGLLQSVDTAASTLTMKVRPFFQPRGDFGEVTLNTLDTTEFEIDETAFIGSAGLEALALLDVNTPVLAMAQFNTDTRQFDVTELLAGSSVPWTDADIARGTIIARSGDTLTLRGATLVRKSMMVTFNDTLNVTIGPDTQLRQVGSELLDLTPADLSVGQSVTVHGDMSDDTLVADEGLVRVRYASLSGTVTAVAPLAVDLSSYNARRPALYDFTGTGLDAANDADPDSYDIDTGSLAVSTLAPGTPVRVLGLVQPFGTAPADFVARSVVNLSAAPAQIRVRWRDEAGADVLLDAGDSALTFALAEETLTGVRYVRRGGVFEDLLERGDSLTFMPTISGRGVYSLRMDGEQTVYTAFSDFAEALVAAMDGTRAIERIRATAMETDATTFEARQILIVLD
ncbi:MAG: DUF4382 domain-containing protein [Pseudomonadota bacterium]